MKYQLSKHALEQISKKGISEELICSVIAEPDQTIELEDKKIFQSVIVRGSGEKYLLRVFVNIKVVPNIIITAYLTSNIDKYYESKI